MFAIQHTNSSKIYEFNANVYSLELNDMSYKTILFSDRSDRIVKTESTYELQNEEHLDVI